MARKNQNTKRKTKPGGTGRRALDAFTSAGARCLMWIIVAGLVAGAIFLGARRAWSALAERPDFALSMDAVAVSGLPASARPGPMLQELRRELRLVVTESTVFDEGLCLRAQHELRASPWILDVISIQRALPNGLKVRAAFREPAGIVAAGEKLYLIDRDGHWLPDWLYRRPAAWDALSLPVPVIVRRGLDTHPIEGRKWDGPALEVGAQLTTVLLRARIPQSLQIKEIDVTSVGRGGLAPEIVLRTKGGAEVRWGCCDAYKQIAGLALPADEPPDSEKLRMLSSLLAEHPGLSGLEHVDLRFNKIFYRPEPPAEDDY